MSQRIKGVRKVNPHLFFVFTTRAVRCCKYPSSPSHIKLILLLADPICPKCHEWKCNTLENSIYMSLSCLERHSCMEKVTGKISQFICKKGLLDQLFLMRVLIHLRAYSPSRHNKLNHINNR